MKGPVHQLQANCETPPLMSDPGSKPIASYLADPESVGRVLLLYSAGSTPR